MYTYFISNGAAVKIGKTINVSHRLLSLQTSSPIPLFVIMSLEGDLEKYYHTLYAPYRLLGEWFSFGAGYYLWLVHQIHRDDLVGDFARDAKDDRYFPRQEDDYYRIMYKISEHHYTTICLEARIGHACAFREWMRLRRRARQETTFEGRGHRRLENYRALSL